MIGFSTLLYAFIVRDSKSFADRFARIIADDPAVFDRQLADNSTIVYH